MSRTIQDENFLVWETFASAGDFGYSSRPHIVFYCLTERNRRPRYVAQPGEKADAERAIATMSEAELVQMLGKSREVE